MGEDGELRHKRPRHRGGEEYGVSGSREAQPDPRLDAIVPADIIAAMRVIAHKPTSVSFGASTGRVAVLLVRHLCAGTKDELALLAGRLKYRMDYPPPRGQKDSSRGRQYMTYWRHGGSRSRGEPAAPTLSVGANLSEQDIRTRMEGLAATYAQMLEERNDRVSRLAGRPRRVPFASLTEAHIRRAVRYLAAQKDMQLTPEAVAQVICTDMPTRLAGWLKEGAEQYEDPDAERLKRTYEQEVADLGGK